MIRSLDLLLQPAAQPRLLRALALPGPLAVAVVAPHPDDFDAIAVTLQLLQQQGHALHVAVVTTGASGVDDGFGGALDDAGKAALRESEQHASCAAFGLPPGRLAFLRMWAGGDDDAPLRDWLDAVRPDGRPNAAQLARCSDSRNAALPASSSAPPKPSSTPLAP
ncbi:MAG: PIG-L family deacetylase, partial [Comamonadaceae bacterium]